MEISVPQGLFLGRTYHVQMEDIDDDYTGYLHYNAVSDPTDIREADCDHICIVKIERTSGGTRFKKLYGEEEEEICSEIENVWEAVKKVEENWEQHARAAN